MGRRGPKRDWFEVRTGTGLWRTILEGRSGPWNREPGMREAWRMEEEVKVRWSIRLRERCGASEAGRAGNEDWCFLLTLYEIEWKPNTL